MNRDNSNTVDLRGVKPELARVETDLVPAPTHEHAAVRNNDNASSTPLGEADSAIRSADDQHDGGDPPEDTPPPPPHSGGGALPNPFPFDALGPNLGPVAQSLQRITRAPDSICGNAVLSVINLAVQGHADIHIFNAEQPISLYLVAIAESGARKSTADKMAKVALKDYGEELAEAYHAQMRDHEVAVSLWEAKEKAIKNDKTAIKAGSLGSRLKALGPRPKPPAYPLLTFPDPTLEGLHRMMESSRPSLGLFSAEGGQFLGGHAMNKDNWQKTAAGVSALWDGEPVERVRATEVIQITGRRVSLNLMVQPNIGKTLMRDHGLRDQGLLSRVLPVFPTSNAGTRFYKEASPADLRKLDEHRAKTLAILRQPLPLKPGSNNALMPKSLSLSEDALEALILFHDEIEAQVGPGGRLAHLRGVASKMPAQAARIAATLSLYDDISAKEIDNIHMIRGIRLARFYLNEWLNLVADDEIDNRNAKADKLLAWMRHRRGDGDASQPFTRQEISQYAPPSLRPVRVWEPLVKILEERNDIIAVSVMMTDKTVTSWKLLRKGS